MPPYNPANDFYMRNAVMYQQPPYQQQFNFPPPQQPQVRANWVSSIEEAKASQIDFTSTNLFLDTSSGKIYLKRIGDNGKPQFLTYLLENDVPEKDPLAEINYRLSNIENVLGGLHESVSSNASVQQSAGISQSAVTAENESNGTTESAGFSKNAGTDKWKIRK